MGSSLSAGAYPHNPLVGNRPMKYAYTMSAQIAQFPAVYHFRYTPYGKSLVYASIPGFLIYYKIERWTFTPSNVEEWRERRKQWYTKKVSPEYDLF